MNAIVPSLVSIWLLAGLAWVARRTLRVAVCPICAGVAGTWLWMLVARQFGLLGIDTSMLPLLLAGSVVGSTYQAERWLPPGRSGALFKSVAIPIGLAAAYTLAQSLWGLLGVLLAVLLLVAAVFFRPTSTAVATSSEVAEELKRQMEQCC